MLNSRNRKRVRFTLPESENFNSSIKLRLNKRPSRESENLQAVPLRRSARIAERKRRREALGIVSTTSNQLKKAVRKVPNKSNSRKAKQPRKQPTKKQPAKKQKTQAKEKVSKKTVQVESSQLASFLSNCKERVTRASLSLVSNLFFSP